MVGPQHPASEQTAVRSEGLALPEAAAGPAAAPGAATYWAQPAVPLPAHGPAVPESQGGSQLCKQEAVTGGSASSRDGACMRT